jgi:lipoprotein-anchoring transpeptidase ErfK/SrfK
MCVLFVARRALPVGRARLLSTVAGVLCAAAAALAPNAASAREMVAFSPNIQPGTIVISAHQRTLFYVVSPGAAMRYRVAVPKSGKEWSGSASVDGKYVNPDWSPPPIVRQDHPELPNLIRGGSPRNPMGIRALTLDRFQVAIHGTTQKMRSSIGTAASYGCIRMLNEDVADLYDRVSVGTPVIMAP